MDIPSTDPGSDFFEISSDEEFADDETGTLPRFSNHLKTRSNDYLKAYCESQTTFMPPELIITSTKDTDTNLAVNEATTSSQNLIRDFPPLSKRTRSWHSCRSATRIRNVNFEGGGLNTAENLQMKLTLKKQVWTGSFSGEKLGNVMEMTRPLSWGNSKSSQFYDCETVLALVKVVKTLSKLISIIFFFYTQCLFSEAWSVASARARRHSGHAITYRFVEKLSSNIAQQSSST
jgi:hypothetical protein